MRLKEFIKKLRKIKEEYGDIEVLVRGRLGFISDVDDVTTDQSHDDEKWLVSIDVDEVDEDNYEFSDDFEED